MKMNDEVKKIIGILLKTIMITILFIIILIFLKIPFVVTFIKTILISLFLTYAIKPLYNRFIKNGMKRGMAGGLLILSLISILILFIVLLIPNLINEIANISSTLDNIFLNINKLLKNIKIIENNYIFNNIMKKIHELGINFVESTMFSIMSLGQNLLTYLVIPVFIYYFLVDGHKFLESILFFFSSHKRKIIKEVLNNIDNVLSKYILSQVLLSVIIAILTFIVLMAYDVNNAVLLSLFNGIVNIIPYFGPILGAVPAAVVSFLTSTEKGLWIIFWLLLIQQVEGNLISPKIIGESVHIHPLLVVILLIVGGEIAGFMGMILAIPVAVIIKVIFEDINYYLY